MNQKSHDNLSGPAAACGRKSDLIDYLYDEMAGPARQPFERHLDDCASCQDELRAFGRVREEMSAWQVGFAPRTEVALPRRKADVLRELINLFPAWARGLALTGAAAALLLFALTAYAAFRPQPNNVATNGPAGQIEQAVQQAVARERSQMAEQFAAQLAGQKQQIAVEYEARLQAVSAEHAARIQTVQAALRNEMKKSNAQIASFRGFFEPGEEQDPWAAGR